MERVLVICIGNSCRSQMAQGILQSFDKNLDVHSAGTKANGRLNANAVRVLLEDGIDISNHVSKSVDRYLNGSWDHVLVLCEVANAQCPAFTGNVKNLQVMPFDDPAHAKGDEAFVDSEFRRVRDEMKQLLHDFYKKFIINDLPNRLK